VIGVAASPTVAEDGVTDIINGVGLSLSLGGGVVELEPPPPPQPAMGSNTHKINAITARTGRGMGRPVTDCLI